MERLIADLYNQAISCRPLGNNLEKALERAEIVRLAALLELLQEGRSNFKTKLDPKQSTTYDLSHDMP